MNGAANEGDLPSQALCSLPFPLGKIAPLGRHYLEADQLPTLEV